MKELLVLLEEKSFVDRDYKVTEWDHIKLKGQQIIGAPIVIIDNQSSLNIERISKKLEVKFFSWLDIFYKQIAVSIYQYICNLIHDSIFFNATYFLPIQTYF